MVARASALREIHATRLLMLSPRQDRLLHAYGWLLDHLAAASAVPIAILGVLGLRRRKRVFATRR